MAKEQKTAWIGKRDTEYGTVGMTMLQKLEANIFYSPDGCWYWLGPIYHMKPIRARMRFRKNDAPAARISYALYKGPTNEMFVCHTCDNALCVNPDHLYLGTIQDNNRDKAQRSMATKGENHTGAKLTNADVITIRQSSDRLSDLARKFHVTPQSIFCIQKRKTWKHI